jgi:hypothetical protein
VKVARVTTGFFAQAGAAELIHRRTIDAFRKNHPEAEIIEHTALDAEIVYGESLGKSNLETMLRRVTRTKENSCACGAFNVSDGEYHAGTTFHRRLGCLTLDI